MIRTVYFDAQRDSPPQADLPMARENIGQFGGDGAVSVTREAL